MAEGLSAVAVKALPRAVARASWSAMRIPRAKEAVGVRTIPARRNEWANFMGMGCNKSLANSQKNGSGETSSFFKAVTLNWVHYKLSAVTNVIRTAHQAHETA